MVWEGEWEWEWEKRKRLIGSEYRADDKTAVEYSLEGGATLHLVLALRGGC
jgi:ubiquitin-like protein Nedd8